MNTDIIMLHLKILDPDVRLAFSEYTKRSGVGTALRLERLADEF